MKRLLGTWLVIYLGRADLKCSVAQLALAWVAKVNEHTSSVILGATKPEQLIENLGAINVLPKLTPEIMEKIEEVLDNKPTPIVSRFLQPPRPLNAPHRFANSPMPLGSIGPWTL